MPCASSVLLASVAWPGYVFFPTINTRQRCHLSSLRESFRIIFRCLIQLGLSRIPASRRAERRSKQPTLPQDLYLASGAFISSVVLLLRHQQGRASQLALPLPLRSGSGYLPLSGFCMNPERLGRKGNGARSVEPHFSTCSLQSGLPGNL